MEGCKQHGSTDHDQAKAEQDASVTSSLGKIRKKFLVMSGKGGVGKTSVSVNLSIALAKKGFTVGLMDVDIHGPDVPRMLGLGGMAGMRENKLAPISYSDNLKVISIESLIPNKDDAIIWRGPMKHSLIRQFVGDVDWGDLDYLIIDCPPGTGDEPLSVAQTIPDARAVIVTTPQEISLADVRKSINFCKTVKMEIFGLIENMSGLVCPGCGEKIDLFGSGGGEKTAAAAAIPFLGRIPIDPAMVACSDSGLCFQEKFENSPGACAFLEIAEKMSPKVKSTFETKEPAEPKRRNSNMKFAVPLADGKLTAHFGHCQEFALIEVEGKKILKKTVLQPPPHEPGVIPKWLHGLEANVIIAGGMGNRAISLFEEYGIKVVTGAPVEQPEALVRSYLDNALVSGANLCDH